MDFINPPPFGRVGDFSNNPIYPQGSTIDIIWTQGKEGVPVSVTLFQLNGTQYMPDFEYITQSVINKTSFTWLVGTSKNLTFSNLFYMCIFEEGSTSADANSHYFNISSKDISPPPTTISTSATTSSPTHSSIAATAAISISSIAPSAAISISSIAPSVAASTSSPPPSHSGSLSAGAKAGIGVGIPVAMALGIGAGFFLFRRHKRQDNNAQMMTVPQGGYYNNGYSNDNYYNSRYHNSGYGPAEVPAKSPVEMGPTYLGEMDTAAKDHQSVPARGTPAEPMRYELHTEDR
ncbi:hypothetical protein K432DRAFT_312958 [Lepidopterella palustris CBS 459.81]|uniref:Mid2 domain-containing protein n=1 Tax=Lepidopterella palustris CBS 459.81 TaxID=1314670 RepID=A0A8E2DX74_9PEZI|nr:hypothetical protein K432DRAFT_312958 [Lepidopterella palustris CBS 459.81]